MFLKRRDSLLLKNIKISYVVYFGSKFMAKRKSPPPLQNKAPTRNFSFLFFLLGNISGTKKATLDIFIFLKSRDSLLLSLLLLLLLLLLLQLNDIQYIFISGLIYEMGEGSPLSLCLCLYVSVSMSLSLCPCLYVSMFPQKL